MCAHKVILTDSIVNSVTFLRLPATKQNKKNILITKNVLLVFYFTITTIMKSFMITRM